MASKIDLLAARRQALVQRAAKNRVQLAEAYSQLEKPARVADLVFSVVQSVRQRPWIVALASAVIGAIGLPKWPVPGRLLAVWNGFRMAQSLVQRFHKQDS